MELVASRPPEAHDAESNETHIAAADETTTEGLRATCPAIAAPKAAMPFSSQSVLSDSPQEAEAPTDETGSQRLLQRTSAGAKVLQQLDEAKTRATRATAPRPRAIHTEDFVVIAIVTCFLVAEAPCAAAQVALTFVEPLYLHSSQLFFYTSQFGNLLVTLNCALDFAIYCLCARRFRELLSDLFFGKRAQNPNSSQAPVASVSKHIAVGPHANSRDYPSPYKTNATAHTSANSHSSRSTN